MKELIWHRQQLPATERYADRVAFADQERTSTYAEHLDRVLRLSDAMRRQLHVQKGDRYAVFAANGHRFQELYHAGLLGTGVVNPLNLRFAPREIAHVLSDSATKVVFCDFIFAGVVDQIREAAGVETVVLMGPGDAPHDVQYEDLVASGEPVVPPEPEEDDPALLMYTGGTTGLPKGVLLQQRAMVLTLYHLGLTFGFDEEDVFLLSTPMFHAASLGAILGIPTAGGRVATVPFFDPGGVLEAAEQHRATNTIMVPTMLAMTFGHPDYRPERLSTLRSLTYGASPMPAPVLAKLQGDLPHVDLFQGYGMTESAALVCALTPADHRRGGERLRSAGRPVRGVVVSIQDENGRELPTGEAGEVCVRGGNFLREYWRRPEETAAALRDGWYRSGDMGYLDGGGYLFLVDRVKDMIVTGGENVYSTEVEQALMAHPAVAQAAVIGVPDDTWGEAVHAVVVLKPATEASAEELIEHARGQIAGYKVPKAITFRTEALPLSGAMKVLKRELRAPFWEGHDRAVH